MRPRRLRIRGFSSFASLDLDLAALPGAQHARWKWLSPEALRDDATVHPNTRAYFPR